MTELDILRKYETRLMAHMDTRQGDARDHAERLLGLIRERISDYEEVTNG